MSEALSPLDPNSYSKPEEAKVTHVDLDWDIDFETKIINGRAVLSVEKVDPSCQNLILDTRDITIKSVKSFETQDELKFSLGSPVASFGSKLEISFAKGSAKSVKIIIEYQTASCCTALQWLNAEQTSGKKQPFLFSQCQAIHCRSLLPCQDSPGVKITYNAKVSAPAELTVLMSALREGEASKEENGKRVHRFRQPVPIPAYLLAIVAGDLSSRQIGPRSHVWAEPDIVDRAADEFAETESMLSTAEGVCGPYVWGIYDLLVLPPSFPFGGMENPCLTFVTPTLLAGDRSLVDVVAHEIAHSWTGNLVTNRNFEHFWLNEGFTVFVERKITGRRHSEQVRHFAAIGGLKDLKYAVSTLGEANPLTALVPKLTGVDPDDAFSTVPYEKGQTLLWYLEDLVGGPKEFEPFLKSYIANFQYRSIDTDNFLEYLNHYFRNTAAESKIKQVDWNAWLNAPGMPPVIPSYDDTLAKVCAALSGRWIDWNKQGCADPVPFSPADIKDFTSNQLQEFLSQLLDGEPLSANAVKTMESVYGFNALGNAEIRFRWLRLCLRAHWEDNIQAAVEFGTSNGRMKYVRPVFRDLFAWDKTRQLALDTYEKVKSQWMHVTAYMVGKDLGLVN